MAWAGRFSRIALLLLLSFANSVSFISNPIRIPCKYHQWSSKCWSRLVKCKKQKKRKKKQKKQDGYRKRTKLQRRDAVEWRNILLSIYSLTSSRSYGSQSIKGSHFDVQGCTWNFPTCFVVVGNWVGMPWVFDRYWMS